MERRRRDGSGRGRREVRAGSPPPQRRRPRRRHYGSKPHTGGLRRPRTRRRPRARAHARARRPAACSPRRAARVEDLSQTAPAAGAARARTSEHAGHPTRGRHADRRPTDTGNATHPTQATHGIAENRSSRRETENTYYWPPKPGRLLRSACYWPPRKLLAAPPFWSPITGHVVLTPRP